MKVGFRAKPVRSKLRYLSRENLVEEKRFRALRRRVRRVLHHAKLGNLAREILHFEA